MGEFFSLTDRQLYVNRELSWLSFEDRLLDESLDRGNLLLERLKFLSITASNLDEFFMVRVATLMDMERSGFIGTDISGLTPKEQLMEISKVVHRFVDRQYASLKRNLIDEGKKKGLLYVNQFEEFPSNLAEIADRFFDSGIFPVLTPINVDLSKPFPLVRNRSVNIGVRFKDGGMSFVEVPSNLKRVVELPSEEGFCFALLDNIIRRNIHKLFGERAVDRTFTFRVMRNADLFMYEDDAGDLLERVEREVEKREWGEAIRIECSDNIDEEFLEMLKAANEVDREDVFYISGPIDLTFLMELYGEKRLSKLRRSAFEPVYPKAFKKRNIFDLISEKDRIICHPFENFDPVIEFLEAAAGDPDVLAIKQTLYRVGGDSRVVKALLKAAHSGKQVTVLVELKARFDEEYNINWARMLEEAGCHVIFSPSKIKIHCKILEVVRIEGDRTRIYVHLGTGNYNDVTAKMYTDVGLFTADTGIGEDAANLFNMLSGGILPRTWNKLSVAPCGLRERFLELIERERKNALKGIKAVITAKLNSLCDKEIIDALYKASMAGVRISLIVRGICCLRPGIEGISDNISVRSIVGNFLEHSRIYRFENGGNPEWYLASADWMSRNMDRRVELLFPVTDKECCTKLNRILTSMLNDNLKASWMNTDGTYSYIETGCEEAYCFQESMCEEIKKMN